MATHLIVTNNKKNDKPMKIEFETKYSIGQIVYAYINGTFIKFQIDNLTAAYNTLYDTSSISYHCTSIPRDEHDMLCMKETFEERCIHTKEEMKSMLKELTEE